MMVQDAYDKIKPTKIQRYYILTTGEIVNREKIQKLIKDIKKEHGCQIIVNGGLPTINYYLRLLDNTDDFMNVFIKTLQNDPEINYEHRIASNKILSEYKSI